MKTTSRFLALFFITTITGLLFSSFFKDEKKVEKIKVKFPYKQAGLTDRQAAAHLLGRFTYGVTPGQIDQVLETGLEKWFTQQLGGNLADDTLNAMLANYDAINLSNEAVLKTYPRAPQVLREAIKDGFLDKDSVNKSDKKQYRDQLKTYMDSKGYKPEQELFRQFINQKILRAAYTNNQLQEIMTDFWFNHFNVSITKNDCAQFIPAYERDVIRPNVFAKFGDLLSATAKSPAMLLYLDNFSSAGTNKALNNNNKGNERLQKLLAAKVQDQMAMGDSSMYNVLTKRKEQQAKKGGQGLNENYAREVMELHTLGVDGGYTQNDVTQAAKVLTGWTIYPITDYGQAGSMRKVIEKIGDDKLQERGFVHEGDFLFAANRHDDGEKTVLGKKFANGGYNEGVDLLNMLAHHPSTAKFISKKLAIRFTSDNPPQTLIDKMAKTFLEKDGDIRQVLVTMVASPEFWSTDALREKTKSPFEFAISAVRSLDADIAQPFMLNTWITKMGQRMYFYQAPTGFPDKGQYWINTGSLLNRMNFGLALASKRIPGITFDLAALNNHHEPESAEAALPIYAKLMLPERDLDKTIQRLTPLINDPNLVKKVDEAAGRTTANPEPQTSMAVNAGDEMMNMSDGANGKERPMKERINKKGKDKNNYTIAQMQNNFGNNSMLSQVVGIIIGSPEFQRK